MKTAEIKAVLAQLGRVPNKHLGQNFLIDVSVIHSAIEAGNVQKGDVILEIGPGLGVLTQVLLNRGVRVLAIEQDRTFADRLEEELGGENLKVIHGDATQVDWIGELSRFDKEGGSWKMIANLPYAVTSMLLRKALWNINPPSVIEVLVQKEVAERAIGLMGNSKKHARASLLSLMIALSAKSARIVRNVPARCFYPAPKVQSAILEIVPMTIDERMERWGIDAEEVMKVAKIGFAHPRKQLASNLGHGVQGMERNLDKGRAENALIAIGLDAKIRAEALMVEHWVALAKALLN